MPVLTQPDLDFFHHHGYILLPDLLTRQERQDYRDLFDRDRHDHPYNWRRFGHQIVNYDALVTSPGFDRPLRHPGILAASEQLMGGPICFSELGARYMAPHNGPETQSWHRDRPHWPEHPLRMDYIQVMLYLTDVDETTHCFSISPESVDQPVLKDKTEQLARGGCTHIHGPAGAVCLFNIAVLHTATVRETAAERKTLQTYYGHRHRPPLSNDSILPPIFWRDHPDEEVRAFYGNLNDVTRVYLKAFGGR